MFRFAPLPGRLGINLSLMRFNHFCHMWRRYTPYEEDPYLRMLGAPAVDPAIPLPRAAPIVPGQPKATRDQPELSQAPEPVDTGFASIDSKHKASQLFQLPAKPGAALEHGPLTADRPALLTQPPVKPAEASQRDPAAAEVPRRKKKVDGGLAYRPRPMTEPHKALEQAPGLSSAVQGPETSAHPSLPQPRKAEALPEPAQPFRPQDRQADAFTGSAQQAVLLDSSALPGEPQPGPALPPPLASEQQHLPIQEPISSTEQPQSAHSAVDPSTAMAEAAGLFGGAPQLDGLATAAVPPAFGSVISPAPEDNFWQRGDLPAESHGQKSAEGPLPADQVHGKLLESAHAGTPFPAAAGETVDMDFWTSAGDFGGPSVQPSEPTAVPEPDYSEPADRRIPADPTSGSVQEHDYGKATGPDSEGMQHDPYSQHQAASDHAAAGLMNTSSHRQASAHRQSPQPSLAPGDAAPARKQAEEGLPCTQDSGVQQDPSSAPAQATDVFNTADVGSSGARHSFGSAFPVAPDKDSSFFEGLGGADTSHAEAHPCLAASSHP